MCIRDSCDSARDRLQLSTKPFPKTTINSIACDWFPTYEYNRAWINTNTASRAKIILVFDNDRTFMFCAFVVAVHPARGKGNVSVFVENRTAPESEWGTEKSVNVRGFPRSDKLK